jgi:hypothetical protein
MPIYSADLPQVHAVSFLWALPALPALAAAKLALAGGAVSRKLGARASGGLAVLATGAAVGLAFAATLVVLLGAPPIGRVLVEAHGLLIDEGAVQVAATATLGRFGALVAFGIAFAGCAGAVVVASRAGRQDADDRELAALCGAVAGALSIVVADDLVLVLVGWEVVAIAAAALVRRDVIVRGAEAVVASRVSQVAWLAGAALLFWGLGGYLGARAGEERGRTFVTVDVGAEAGSGIELRTIGDRPNVAAVRPVSVGPTLSSSEISDQLALRDTGGARPFAETLAARTVGPFPLAPLAYALLLLGAFGLAVSVLLSFERGMSGAGSAAVGIAALLASLALVGRVSRFLGYGPGWPLIAFPVLFSLIRANDARLVRGALRELGSLPAMDLSVGAAWLERRVVGPAARVLTLTALAVALVLLAR